MLDIEDPRSLVPYLLSRGHIADDEKIQLEVLRGGVSNKTVRVQREDGPPWVLKQALPKLRVASEWFSDPARIWVEAKALRLLPRITPMGVITPLVFEDRSANLLCMEAVPFPHTNWKQLLLAGELELSHVKMFADILASIHVNAYKQREEYFHEFQDRTFFDTLRLEPYYRFSAHSVPAARAFLEQLISATWARTDTIVHGDFSPKNILIRSDRMILLDHEVVHFGDPAFDVGFSLTHLLSKAHFMAEASPDLLKAAELYWRTYRSNITELPWANELEQRVIKHTIGCLLARAVGRSPLEYFNPQHKSRQTRIALELIDALPSTTEELIFYYGRKIRP